MKFLKEFLTHPKSTGAIAPSSKKLAELMVSTAELADKKLIVELGPGTGVFTTAIMKTLSPGTEFFCVESNEMFAKELKVILPDCNVYTGFAQDLPTYLQDRNATQCDCVISGLPWAAFDKELQQELMSAIYNSLEDGGVFLTFAYSFGTVMPNGIAFKKLLHETFGSVERTSTVWKNLPPAFVYVCKK